MFGDEGEEVEAEEDVVVVDRRRLGCNDDRLAMTAVDAFNDEVLCSIRVVGWHIRNDFKLSNSLDSHSTQLNSLCPL